MGKWGKWALLLVVAMAFAVPAWAVDLKLGGKYEIQGRYYNHAKIQELDGVRDRTNPIHTMYLKHYFNLYPTIEVNDKIQIKADLEVFDNKISKSDSYHSYDKSSSAATNIGRVGQADVDYYSLLTVNELYIDALTGFGKFIVGKTNKFDGIGWFIQVPDVPDWTFGLVWNKLNEANNLDSYYHSDAGAGDLADNDGVIVNRDMADEDDFALLAMYAKDGIDFHGKLAYKYAGKDNCRTSIWVPEVALKYALNENIKFNGKLGFGTGVLVDKKSKVAEAGIEEASVVFGEVVEEAVAGTALEGVVTAAVAEAAFLDNFNGAMKKDWEADNGISAWLGMGVGIDALKVQVDAMYLKGADEPQNVSSYAEDNEGLDTWLMNDIADIYSARFQTPGTINALLPGGKRDTASEGGLGSKWDGAFSYANAILARLNLAYKFTPKLDGNLNLVWAMMENTDYLENWNSDLGVVNAFDPAALKVGGPGIPNVVPDAAIAAPAAKYDVDDDMGWEARARLNYALQDNLSLGLDLCYYAPGKLYKGYIEEGWVPGNDTGVKMKNTYAARWKATVKF